MTPERMKEFRERKKRADSAAETYAVYHEARTLNIERIKSAFLAGYDEAERDLKQHREATQNFVDKVEEIRACLNATQKQRLDIALAAYREKIGDWK